MWRALLQKICFNSEGVIVDIKNVTNLRLLISKEQLLCTLKKVSNEQLKVSTNNFELTFMA